MQLIRVVSRANYFWKTGGTQNWKYPNRDIKFSKSRNNWCRLNPFKANEVEK